MLRHILLSFVVGMFASGVSAQVEPMVTKRHTPLIIGGKDADDRTATYVVALMREGLDFPQGFLCGGTIVADGWVLTAAHCLYDGKCGLRRFMTLYTINGTSLLRPGLGKLSVTEVRPHAGFQCIPVEEQIAAVKSGISIPMGNDIGLVRVPGIKLSRPPLFVPSENVVISAVKLEASGWGTLGSAGLPSPVLKSVMLTSIAPNLCIQAWAPSSVSNDQLCVSAPAQNPVSGVCSGDSGGPLVATLGNNRFQAGIISLGHFVCSNVDRPSLFTNVATHRAWIENIIGIEGLPHAVSGCTEADVAARAC